ncbi:MAG: Radical domain protein [Clostridiaceae bacterium]|jgi:radical SAM superfamily enzyme YgiQ (UPF0313 family)|nr:Radical domain protein [Clostridiaceae bacterium]
MKILLIHPAYKDYKITEPLGICYISSYLKSKGFDVDILDPRIYSFDLNMMIQYLENKIANYFLIGITCCDYYHEEIIQTIDLIKIMGFKGHITLGGYGPTTNWKKFCSMGADSVVIGEGEVTFYNLATKLKEKENWKEVEGIAYIDGLNIIKNKHQMLIKDLDTLPYPSREIYEKMCEVYGNKFISPQIQGSRGCYMKCSFCSTPDYLKCQEGEVYRVRTIVSIVNEIEYLNKTYNITDFEFVDDNFLLPDKENALKRVKEFNYEVLKRKLNITFFMQFRPEYISFDILTLLKSAGMTRFFLGLESINSKDLSLYNRTYIKEDVENALDIILRVGYSTDLTAEYRLRYGYINFNPLSTLEGLKESGKFFKKYGLTYKKLSKKLILFDNKRAVYNKIIKEFPEYSEENQFKSKRVGKFYKYLIEYFDKYSYERDNYRVLEKAFIKLNNKTNDYNFILSNRKKLDDLAFYTYMKGIEISSQKNYKNELPKFFNKRIIELDGFINLNKEKIDNSFKKLNIKKSNDMFF